jgi:hypothetical protein
LGNSVEHLVGTSKNKGLKTPLKSNPTPCKNNKNQHRMEKTQFVAMDCVFGSLKMGEKNKKWWKVGFL